jgi:hypothetical protein
VLLDHHFHKPLPPPNFPSKKKLIFFPGGMFDRRQVRDEAEQHKVKIKKKVSIKKNNFLDCKQSQKKSTSWMSRK